MGRRLEYEVKTSVRLNMSNPQHVKINDVIQNLDPKRGLNISGQKILMTLRKKSLKQQPMRLGKRS